MRYLHRIIESDLRKYLENFPVVGVTGPRQSGKSTLIQHVLKDYRYVSFDDFRMRNFIAEDPIGFIDTYDNRIIFDEAQKVPELFELIKIAVDRDRSNYGKFVVTGSSQFALVQKISESLAGRIGLLNLLPFQYQELPKKHREQSIYLGSYPELTQHNYESVSDWYSSYIETYLNKDIRDIKDIGNLRDFRRFLYLLAANTSQILNMSKYSNDLGVSVPTIKSWLSVLEASYIIFLLPPFYKNFGKRINKSPKVYFYDTGLVGYLTAINNYEQYKYGPMAGPLFENYIVSEILKIEKHCNTHAELYYYRENHGLEVDLIIDRKQSREFIEIKSGKTFTARMAKPMETIMEENDQGFILYTGEVFHYKSAVKVMHYSDYLQGVN